MSITFDAINAVDNGAQFFNADLHVHSFGASHDVKDSTMTVEAIIDEAVKLGIQILAITDHNTEANTQKSITYAQKYTGQILVLAGVEITTSNGHLLVYFAPNQAANVRNLLAKINLIGNPGEQNSHTSMSKLPVLLSPLERKGRNPERFRSINSRMVKSILSSLPSRCLRNLTSLS